MSQLDKKTTCIFYESLFEAAERFHQKGDYETEREIYRSFCRYAFCRTEDVETDNEIAELLVRQNIESLNAADNRYANAVRNGDKGKEYGILGKEYGKLGGRPRKGESREEYWERKRMECETKNPPENPPLSGDKETPLTTAIATSPSSSEAITSSSTTSESVSKDVEVNQTVYLDEKADVYLRDFFEDKTQDYSKIITDYNYFVQRNNSRLIEIHIRLRECGYDKSIQEIMEMLKSIYKERISHKVIV